LIRSPLLPPANSIGCPACSQSWLPEFSLAVNGRKHVVIVDDAILIDFDEAGAPVGVRGLQHVDQILVNVDAAGDEAGARSRARKRTG
jgi:hypothetical protein